jgi:glycosyltransferase involved in cell wall biosynthesis
MKYKFTFSVITPTYNRSHFLYRVYQSLYNQTFQDFEWIVINDGSTDNTDKIISQLIQDSSFYIQYIYQENSGLHVARNKGVTMARGYLSVFLDDDDILTPFALERFWYWWNQIPPAQQDKFAGVTALCADLITGEIIGDRFPRDVMVANNVQMFGVLRVRGDKARCFRTEILRAYPWPTDIGRYVTASLVYNRISKSYLLLFVNEVLMLKQVGTTHPRITHKKRQLLAKSPYASHLYFKEYLEHPLPLLERTRALIHYIRYSFHANISLCKQIADSPYKLLYFPALPIGYLLYRKDVSLLKKLEGMKY